MLIQADQNPDYASQINVRGTNPTTPTSAEALKNANGGVNWNDLLGGIINNSDDIICAIKGGCGPAPGQYPTTGTPPPRQAGFSWVSIALLVALAGGVIYFGFVK